MSSLQVLRWLAILEGTSLLLLVFIAVPFKRLLGIPTISQVIGPIHGALFLLFVVKIITFAVEREWKFTEITWKVLIACFIPFGTFYVDHKILRHLDE